MNLIIRSIASRQITDVLNGFEVFFQFFCNLFRCFVFSELMTDLFDES